MHPPPLGLRHLAGLSLLALSAACNSDKSLGPVVDLITCPPSATGGDLISRGFYIDSFPGVSLKEVHLWFSSSAAGSYQLRLTAQRDSYAGPLVGTGSATITMSANVNDSAQATFDFGGRSIAKGKVVAFSLAVVSGAGGNVYFGVATSNASCPVTETEGTSPPLDLYRRAGIAVRVTGSAS